MAFIASPNENGVVRTNSMQINNIILAFYTDLLGLSIPIREVPEDIFM